MYFIALLFKYSHMSYHPEIEPLFPDQIYMPKKTDKLPSLIIT